MSKNLKVLIVEDEHLAAEGLKSYVAEIAFLELVASCENALEANKLLSEQSIDLIFLDIQMPKITGIEFLKSLSKPPMVIFTTAYPNYALQGYELDVIDYLVKPYPFDRFLKAVNKAKDRFVLENSNNQESAKDRALDCFFVKSDQKLEKVVIKEICYVEAMENYVIIHTDSQKIISLMTMKSMEEKLPPAQFIRSHKSYIVNISKVESIEGNCLNVKSKQLPISRQNKSEVLNRIIR
ncbi:LytTR family DNA-binding domain-containing protein [Marivirga harenae]|uniref:LytR/AlgR family response regulator transcription factor n=1 Tax=Marivirga harenae TaxID=2010992 RepID=UPI0026E08EAC|nr:LytTR family DNA-binding domain-containing protein [Marivirga harenae]WKV11241.1 LytTR family DNA-binding domain-containing protein [Marivirga harenae]|tara:strand:+ start:126673 stop:127386 length:714 start_codon:yes stop_codon:yes gene_type:complete